MANGKGIRAGDVYYTPELADEICARLERGESLNHICKDAHMPEESVVRGWYVDDKDDFASKYARARNIALDLMAEETLRIADTTEEGVKVTDKWTGTEITRADMTEHRRLRVDTRKWYLSKLAPKRYGERLHTELTGADGGPIEISAGDDEGISTRLIAILDSLKRRMADDGYDIV